MLKALNKAKDGIVDALFPAVCVSCGKEGKYICDNCSVFIGEAALICPVCDKSNFTGEKHTHCSEEYGLDGLVSIWEYEGIIKKLLDNIKYNRSSHVIIELTRKAFEVMARDKQRFNSFLSFLLPEETGITFVPIHKKKEKQRGFNQADLIAKSIGKISNREIRYLLIKIKETLSQIKLNREERIENVRDAFQQKEKIDCFSNVILVNDIWISGATMKECCKVLKKAGAQKVWGFTLARTA